jgi:hypothetical protein
MREKLNLIGSEQGQTEDCCEDTAANKPERSQKWEIILSGYSDINLLRNILICVHCSSV